MGDNGNRLSTYAPTTSPSSPSESLWRREVKWIATKIGSYSFQLMLQCLAEIWGTALVVIFGNGMMITGIAMGEAMGIVQIALIWTIGIALAIYTTASISGGHLNPAISLAFALVRSKDFPLYKLPFYIVAQILGGMLGAVVNLKVFGSVLDQFERMDDIDKGESRSLMTAMFFGSYFPSPTSTQQPFDNLDLDTSGNFFDSRGAVSRWGALCVEAWGTCILGFVIFSLTHRNNFLRKSQEALAYVPLLIGATVGALISVYSPLTQMSINPARDFGPRLVAWLYGWDSVAIPGPRDGFWIYIVGPMAGALVGAAFHDFVLAYGFYSPDMGFSDCDNCTMVWRSGNSAQVLSTERDASAIHPSHPSPSKRSGARVSPRDHTAPTISQVSCKPESATAESADAALPPALQFEPPMVVSSLRVITETEISQEKLALSVDEAMENHAAARKDPNSVHICQFFHVSADMIVEDSPTAADARSHLKLKYLKPLAQVKCTIDECAIPRTVIQKAASRPTASTIVGAGCCGGGAAAAAAVPGDETVEGGSISDDPGCYLVLFVSVTKN